MGRVGRQCRLPTGDSPSAPDPGKESAEEAAAERGFGRRGILSFVSAEHGGGVFGRVAYSAAKAGLLGFVRALARELGPPGVTVLRDARAHRGPGRDR
ncbi:SDR family NAD(P)-dependent oxidoreductase [Streptomyces tibetensis]|uniref:SDR family NAD(P)-dependent oxidoreductase n=1 Tax=Streptomyces tibetensis TaxID=2382123 RepID=UPI0033FAB3E7